MQVDQPDAQVSVDDGKITLTTPDDEQPVEIQVATGEHTIKVSKGGFQAFTQEFQISKGGKQQIRVTLKLEKAVAAAPPSSREPQPSPETVVESQPTAEDSPKGPTSTNAGEFGDRPATRPLPMVTGANEQKQPVGRPNTERQATAPRVAEGNRDGLFAASSPTGPAFEGAQISSGQRATVGAIERVRIDIDTLEPLVKVIGVEPWSDDPGFDSAVACMGITGVCGSGIIDAIAELGRRCRGIATA